MADAPKRQRWKILAITLNLLAGLFCIDIGLRHFNSPGFLDGYNLPEYRRIFRPVRHPGGEVFLPFAAGLLFLIAAAVTWLNYRRNPEGNPEPADTTLVGPHRHGARLDDSAICVA